MIFAIPDKNFWSLWLKIADKVEAGQYHLRPIL
jgi:hypothetical protein